MGDAIGEAIQLAAAAKQAADSNNGDQISTATTSVADEMILLAASTEGVLGRSLVGRGSVAAVALCGFEAACLSPLRI